MRRTKPYRPEDTRQWVDEFERGDSVLRISGRHGVDPGTVSKWLHRSGVNVYSGRHFVKQPELKYRPELVNLVGQGSQAVLDFVDKNVWGVSHTGFTKGQLSKFCDFVIMHQQGKGVGEIGRTIVVHRSTVLEWREATDQPFHVRLAARVFENVLEPGWKVLPLHLSSGGEEQQGWIKVPSEIRSYEDVAKVVGQLPTLPGLATLGREFGIEEKRLQEMRTELFAYLLAMMAGDSSKSGGKQQRFASMNLDLQLTLKQPSNERLGKFVCMCANSLGIEMHRVKDKGPSGSTRFGRQPSAAYRWISERSPLLAWMFFVGLGLNWHERTSYNQLHAEWILSAPRMFQLRFIQGLADSDGAVKHHQVIITSVPNAEFVSNLLQSLGVHSAHPILEYGRPIRTYVNLKHAAALPLFNEFTEGYRYLKLRKQSR